MAAAAIVAALMALATAQSVTATELRGGARHLLELEPSQVFMIACLAIGGFVLLVALLAALVVMNRYSSAAEPEQDQDQFMMAQPYGGAYPYPYQYQYVYPPQGQYMGQEKMMLPQQQMMMQPQQQPMQPMNAGAGAGAGQGVDPVAAITSEATAGVMAEQVARDANAST